MSAHNPRRRRIRQDEDEQDESQVNFQPQIILHGDFPQAAEIARTIADYTAPGLTWTFVVLFILLTYVHEVHLVPTFAVIAVWLGIQLIRNILEEDFQTRFLWNCLGLLANIGVYIFIGFFWSHAKLYMDVWQKHLPETLSLQLTQCLSETGDTGCLLSFVYDIKWLIVQWMLTWPMSMVYTLSRDPLRIATDLLFEWSQQRYASIIAHAAGNNRPEDTMLLSTGDLYFLFYVVIGYLWTHVKDTMLLSTGSLYLLFYVVIGYLWAHVKLFIDVWQKRLPPRLEVFVQESHWSLVKNAKLLIATWVIAWPFSLLHTLLRDPLRMLANFIYSLSERKYVWITGKAVEWRE
jgi:hypothetical protein